MVNSVAPGWTAVPGIWGMVTNPSGEDAPLVKVDTWNYDDWDTSFADACIEGKHIYEQKLQSGEVEVKEQESKVVVERKVFVFKEYGEDGEKEGSTSVAVSEATPGEPKAEPEESPAETRAEANTQESTETSAEAPASTENQEVQAQDTAPQEETKED